MSRDRRRKSGQVIHRAEKRVRLVANGLIPSAEPGDKWAAYSPTAAEVDEWRRNKSLIARLASHAGVPVWAVPALIRCSKRSRRGRPFTAAIAITLRPQPLGALRSSPIPRLPPASPRSPTMASHDDDTMPEETQGYKLSQPKQSLAEYQQMDAGDESLQRYKESLGLGGGTDISDPNDPRVCIILSLTMDSPGRDPVTIDLSTPGSENTLKDKPFTIKEGAKFTMSAKFKVQHEILSGLHYVQVVKRKGIRVSKDSEMIGSYAPNTDRQTTYEKRFQEEEAPSGMLARGHYNAVSSFVDDDKKKHLEFEWSFDIAKDW
ncbi:hypothetical protein MRS44_006647 [Fusarium solani]|nr:hypothetical protein MRS44_006647 [Fusarium solani]